MTSTKQGPEEVETEYNTFYVDIPSPECVTDQDGPMINIDSFATEQEALDFASKHFGADATGRVRLISGADFSKQDALEKAAPAMYEALEALFDYEVNGESNCPLCGHHMTKQHESNCRIAKAQTALKLARGGE